MAVCSAGIGGLAETIDLGEAPEPDLRFGSRMGRFEREAEGDDDDDEEEDDYEDEAYLSSDREDEDEESPAYGAIPGVRIMRSTERRSPSPTAVPLRSCLKKQKPLLLESDAEDNGDAEGEAEPDMEVEVEVEVEEYMMAGLLSGKADEKSKRQEAEEMDEVDWQWRTLPFLLPTRGRADWTPFLPQSLIDGGRIDSYDPLVELGGLLRNALFDHGRGRNLKSRKLAVAKVRSASSTPSSPRSVDGILTPTGDDILPYAGDYDFTRRASVVGHLQTVGMSKRVRFPGCPEATGEVALCSLYPTWSRSEYDRSPLEPPSEEEKACKMPERGSRCLSDPEEDLSAYADRLATESFRMGTIFESDDDYDLVVLGETRVRSLALSTTRQGWSSWCSNDSYGGGSACDEFGLEGNSGTWGQEQQDMYDSWQAEGECGLSGEMAEYFSSASPTESDRSSDEEEANEKEDEDEDDDCWEAWLDARKSNKTSAVKEAEAAVPTNGEVASAEVAIIETQIVVVAVDPVIAAVASTGISGTDSGTQLLSQAAPSVPALLPTPDYGRLHDSVYDPAEDSFALLDALEADAKELKARNPTICLEIGSGSGIASTFLSSIVEPSSALFLSTDINPHACLATLATSRLNQAHLNPINTNLVSPILQRIEAAGGADILLFNPPYVPTEEDELTRTQLAAEIGATWAGGADGMVVTNIVLDLLPRILNPNGGTLYLVAVSANKPTEIIATMAERGFRGEVSLPTTCLTCSTTFRLTRLHVLLQIVLKRRAGIEMLHILKLTRT